MGSNRILATILVVTLATAGATASAGALAASGGASTTAIDGSVTVTVTDVVDGDTVDVQYPNGSTDTVRLLGVDTPEVYVENTPGEYEGVPDTQAGRECLGSAGDAASAYATDRLAGETVTLKFDSESDRRGYYGRLIAYVYVDGSNFNYDLVETGHARVYDSTFSQSQSFYDAESDAQSAQRNLWSCRTPDGDGDDGGDGGSASGDLTIDWVNAEAASLNEERVKLTNTGNGTVDLGGYTLSDAAGYSYTLPDGFTLAAGASVYVHTGSGTNDADDLYVGYETEIWNDGGDTATVTAPDGTQVDQLSYGDSGDSASGDLTISWVNAEADSLNEERVKLTNTGDGTVDLGGYTLSDAAGHSYTFPDGFTLAAGESVYVHTGSGTNDADDLYAGYGTEIWNDGGDTATVTAPDGTQVGQLAY